MAYSKTIWVNDSTPALDAVHLNNIEDGIEDIDARLTAAESSLTQAESDISSIEFVNTTQTTAINTINSTLGNAIVIFEGTYQGTWSPTLNSTFNLANYNDYNWSVNVHQTSRLTTNGHTVNLDGYLDADNVTLRFTSDDNGTAVAAKYRLIGIKKTISSKTTINQ